MKPNKSNEETISYFNRDHESRITRVEVVIESIGQNLKELNNKMDRMNDKIDSNFRWLLSVYGAGFMILLSLILKLMKVF